MAGPSSRLDVRCSAAAALALLPRAVADDAAAWSNLIRRVLLSLHTAIDLLLYHGGGIVATAAGGAASTAVIAAAPDGGLGERAREHLEASGLGVADAQGLLGSMGFVTGEGGGAAAVASRPDVMLTVQVMSALLHCLVTLVGRGSTSPVPVPSHAILLLVMRMLKVDAAVLLAPGRTAPSASAQSAVLAVLPDLHVSGWELLGLTTRVTRSTMMPLMALVGRLLGEHLRRIKAGGAGGLAVTMPASVRTSLYRTTTAILRVGGFAAGRYLAVEIVGMLVTELYGLSATQQQEKSKAGLYGSLLGGAGRGPAAAGASQLPAKRAKTNSDPLAAFDAATAAAAAAAIAPLASPADVEAQVAALEVAEALLQVYGPALSIDLRGQLDALSYHMAAVLAEAAYRVSREPGTAAAARAADAACLRVAATRTLIASLAAPWPSRHPFLSEGLQLLSSGASGAGGVALAEVSSEGLLALEALLRPRSVPSLAARSGSSAADAMQGMLLPRPRLWSMFDPVQLQLPALPAATVAPTPVGATAVDNTADKMAVDEGSRDAPVRQAPSRKVAQLAANGAQEMEVGTAEGRNVGSGDESRKLSTASERATALTPAAVAVPSPLGAAQRKGAKGKVEGKSSAPAFASLASGVGDKGRGDKNAEAAAAAADAMEVDDTGAVVQSAPAQVQQHPATAVVKPSSGRSAAPVATAAVFGEESEDSEGALPEIDSGNDSDGSDD
ncbi:hypothetical protein Vafri_19231 [Volvox africanus]|nr:hypothetical protein Vafri_19231 [Volvox africanus]